MPLAAVVDVAESGWGMSCVGHCGRFGADPAAAINSSPLPGTIAAMSQLYVEGWAPEYGSPYETDETLADEGKVDESVEIDGVWSPISGVDDGIGRIVFVDGVRRIDARLTLDEPDGPIPGICGSFGVGAVAWDRDTPRAEFTELLVDRLAVFGNGRGAPVPPDSQIVYRSESVPDTDPGMLIQRFHGAMRKAEAVLVGAARPVGASL